MGLAVHHAIRGRVITHLQAANAPFRGRVPPPCPHLAVHRLSSRPLRFLHCLRVRPLGRPEIRWDPCELPRCSPYAAASPSPTFRLYACLSCATVFCPSHAATHASASAGLAAFAERSRRARFDGWAFVPCGAVAAGAVRGGRLAGGGGRGGIERAVVARAVYNTVLIVSTDIPRFLYIHT